MNRLKELREAKKFTKEFVANQVGLPRVTISLIEAGKRPMRLQHAKLLAPFFGVSVDYMMGTDAIYYAGSFEDAVGNLLDDMFDDFVESSVGQKLDDRTRLLYSIIQRLIRSKPDTGDLKVIIDILDRILKDDKEG